MAVDRSLVDSVLFGAPTANDLVGYVPAGKEADEARRLASNREALVDVVVGAEPQEWSPYRRSLLDVLGGIYYKRVPTPAELEPYFPGKAEQMYLFFGGNPVALRSFLLRTPALAAQLGGLRASLAARVSLPSPPIARPAPTTAAIPPASQPVAPAVPTVAPAPAAVAQVVPPPVVVASSPARDSKVFSAKFDALTDEQKQQLVNVAVVLGSDAGGPARGIFLLSDSQYVKGTTKIDEDDATILANISFNAETAEGVLRDNERLVKTLLLVLDENENLRTMCEISSEQVQDIANAVLPSIHGGAPTQAETDRNKRTKVLGDLNSLIGIAQGSAKLNLEELRRMLGSYGRLIALDDRHREVVLKLNPDSTRDRKRVVTDLANVFGEAEKFVLTNGAIARANHRRLVQVGQEHYLALGEDRQETKFRYYFSTERRLKEIQYLADAVFKDSSLLTRTGWSLAEMASALDELALQIVNRDEPVAGGQNWRVFVNNVLSVASGVFDKADQRALLTIFSFSTVPNSVAAFVKLANESHRDLLEFLVLCGIENEALLAGTGISKQYLEQVMAGLNPPTPEPELTSGSVGRAASGTASSGAKPSMAAAQTAPRAAIKAEVVESIVSEVVADNLVALPVVADVAEVKEEALTDEGVGANAVVYPANNNGYLSGTTVMSMGAWQLVTGPAANFGGYLAPAVAM